MGKTTGIEWADATWNPWIGCTKVSAGCMNCYMFREQRRFGHDPTVLRRSKTTFYDPLKWKRPRRVFVCSWSDFFHPDVPYDWRRDAWDVIRHRRHIYMILTKRPENIWAMLPSDWDVGWPHVWLGVTAEDQAAYEQRVPILARIPATVRFVSAEPLLGPLGLLFNCTVQDISGARHGPLASLIHWVIVGGESGPAARPMHGDWLRSIRNQCLEADVPFFFKQWGGNRRIDGAWGGRLLDGRVWDEVPLGG